MPSNFNQVTTFNTLKTWAEAEPACWLVLLFGSCASDRANKRSDVDLALWWESPLTAELCTSINTHITALLPKPLDLVDLRQTNGPLLRRILTEGKTLVDRKPGLRGNLYVRLMDWETDFKPAWREQLKQRRKLLFESSP